MPVAPSTNVKYVVSSLLLFAVTFTLVARVAVPVIEVNTYALSALEEPASTNANNPPVTSAAESASTALVRTPATPTAGAVVTL